MTEANIKRAGGIVGQDAYHKVWTAHGLPNPGLGLDIGLEASFLLRRNLIELGDETGVVPRVIPVPKFWFAWDLPRDFMFSGSVGPGFLFDGVTTVGTGLQWKFWKDTEISTQASFVFHYNFANAFGDLKTNTLGLDAQISRDLVLWQPYAGVGFMFTGVSANSRVVDLGVSTGTYGLWAVHGFIGARIDLMAKLGFQLDFINNRPSFSVLIANTF